MATAVREIDLDAADIDFPRFSVRLGYRVSGMAPHAWYEGYEAVSDRAEADFPIEYLGSPDEIGWRFRVRRVQIINDTTAIYTAIYRQDITSIGGNSRITSRAGVTQENLEIPEWTKQRIQGQPDYWSFRPRQFPRQVAFVQLTKPVSGVAIGELNRVLATAVGTLYQVGGTAPSSSNEVANPELVYALDGFEAEKDSQGNSLTTLLFKRPARMPAKVDQLSGVSYPPLDPLQFYVFEQPTGADLPIVEATAVCDYYRSGLGIIGAVWFASNDFPIYAVGCPE